MRILVPLKSIREVLKSEKTLVPASLDFIPIPFPQTHSIHGLRPFVAAVKVPNMPLDHFNFQVPQDKFEDVITFLKTSLEHMGFKEYFRPIPHVIGMGDANPYLWISAIDTKDQDSKIWESFLKHTHIAFTAESKHSTTCQVDTHQGVLRQAPSTSLMVVLTLPH
jgi:hypothetical protein